MEPHEKRTAHELDDAGSEDVDDQDPTGPKRMHRDSGNPSADREFLQNVPPVAASAVEDVPAGHGGADSGAADAVGVDPATEEDAEEPSDAGEHNDAAGVGPRPPDRGED